MRNEVIDYFAKFDYFIDLGYLSFILGSMDSGGGWVNAKVNYVPALYCDDHRSFRFRIFEEYKSRRRSQRELDPKKMRVYAKVKRFREEVILPDANIQLAKVYGAEADDLVAICHLLTLDSTIVAVDKDLHAVPSMFHQMEGYQSISRTVPLWEKFPKYMQNTARKPWELFLIQALRGDKSDSIPRLLPSNIGQAKWLWSEIYQKDNPGGSWDRAAYYLGADVVDMNARLVLMPGPNLRDDIPRWFDILDLLDSGKYWEAEAWSGVLEKAMEFAIDRNSEIVAQYWPS